CPLPRSSSPHRTTRPTGPRCGRFDRRSSRRSASRSAPTAASPTRWSRGSSCTGR
ncbi:MAG: hypothetical protein AVDCRST_MAG19-3206, partial [uncultured Thermomicrobiales bacterium]